MPTETKIRLRLFDFYAATSHLIMFPGDFGLGSAFSFLPLRRLLLVYAYLSGLEFFIALSSPHTWHLRR